MHALRIALAGLIDYAGLFPPAGLDLARVVRNHFTYADGSDRWLLGRLVVPSNRLDDLGTLLTQSPVSTSRFCTLTIIAKPEDAAGDLSDRLALFNDRFSPAGVSIVSVEVPALNPDDVARVASEVPDRYERYIEVPLDGRLPAFIERIGDAGCSAKIRTGGIVATAFPSSAALASFVNQCVGAGIAFKATAGLHHPLRGSYRLTYEADSTSSVMHGFVNLVIATALLREGRVDEHEAITILETTDPQVFQISGDGISWKSHRLAAAELKSTRARCLRTVGSCSFEDAISDLRRIGWLDIRIR